MALKDVKTEAGGGGKNGSRWVTRAEAKDGARRIRREDDKARDCGADGHVPTNYRTAWVCEVCGACCDGPEVPEPVLNTPDEDAMYMLLTWGVGYSVDLFGGMLTLRSLEDGRYAVSWEASGDRAAGEELFEDARKACRHFIALRKAWQIGLDFEKETA